MPAKESQITARIIAMLRARGAYAVKQHGSRFGSKGVPDVLACYRSRFIAIEVKRPGPDGRRPERSPTPHQVRNIKDILRASGAAIVATTLDQAETLLDSIDEQIALAERQTRIRDEAVRRVAALDLDLDKEEKPS